MADPSTDGNHGIHVGTSGWTYPDWQGPFYPPEVKGSERLTYYATRFDTVEVNATFYRLPTAAMVGAWNKRLGPDFHLVVKGSRQVTHYRRLRDCVGPLAVFLERIAPLHALRVVLWQLPPSLQRDDALLEAFLAALPITVRHAVEFRHPSWWDDAVAALLAHHGAALVAVSHPRLPDAVVPTTDFLYVRFHGLGPRLYNYDYTGHELSGWAGRLRPHLAGRTLYAFFNNDFRANAPRNAERLRALLQAPGSGGDA